MICKNKNEVLGQMLIEVVVAIGIIAMVLVGVADLLTRSLYTMTYQRHKEEASAIIQKIQNDYKLDRDTDPELFYSSVASRSSYQCVPGREYMCTVFVNETADLVTITVKAEWTDGGKIFETSTIQSLVRSVK